jgi:hypothetical protein
MRMHVVFYQHITGILTIIPNFFSRPRGADNGIFVAKAAPGYQTVSKQHLKDLILVD